MKRLCHILCFLILSLLASCSTETVKNGTEAEVLFKEIKSNYKAQRYLLALEKISTFRSKFPYSFFVTEVELLRADIYFEQKNFLEAVDAYMSFKDFHPKYKNLDLIEWRIAESFFYQLPDTVDRDISPAHSAIDSYNNLIEKYPKSEHIAKALERIISLKKMLEEKESYIADFYFRTKDYQSASYRYEKLLKHITNDSIIESSVRNLIYSYSKLLKKEKCLGTISNYLKLFEPDEVQDLKSKCNSITKG